MPITVASDKITFTDNTSLSSGIISTEQLAAGAVTTDKIVNNAITTNQIGFSGCVLQTVENVNANYIATTAQFPFNDTIPLITGGVQVLSAAITPSSLSSKILIRTHIYVDATGYYPIMAVFRGSGPQAIFAHMNYGTVDQNFQAELLDSPNTISSVTYSVRVGQNPTYGGTAHINGWYNTAARLFGGATKSILVLQEIKG